MALFDTLSSPADENATATLHSLLKGLRANVTRATVRQTLEQHPDFPSLLSLSEVLTDWKIDNTALQLNTTEQLREMPLPFVAHLRRNGGWYVLVTALQGDKITYTDNSKGRNTETVTEFEQKWSGVVLLAEADEQSGEADYAPKRKQEFLTELRGPFLLSGVTLLTLIALLSVAKTLNATDWLLLLSKSMGLALSILLVAKQLGSKNALTDRLCRINSKANCDDVLNSPAAKLWGWLSWTDVGVLYFAGGLLTMLDIGVQPAVRPLVHGLALLALPYTLFSVYYQGIVLKQWCPLCLGVQGILLIEGIWAIMQFNPIPGSIQPYSLILSTFLLPTLVWAFVKPLLTAMPKSRREHDELMRLKRDPDLFRAMLMQQPKMPPIPTDLHPVVLGNPEAEHTITMVTNPYCKPCAELHKQLEQLLHQNQNINAQIIFLACDGKIGNVHEVARHLLALDAEHLASDFLTNWYDDKRKDYAEWATHNPIKSELIMYDQIVDQHCAWCKQTKVEATPTLFVDGYVLPELYELNSLRWQVNCLSTLPQTKDLIKS